MSQNKQFNARIPPELHARLIEIAEERNVSLAKLVTALLEEAIQTKHIPLRATTEGYHFAIPPDQWFLTNLLGYCGEPDQLGESFLCSDCVKEKKQGCGRAIYNHEQR